MATSNITGVLLCNLGSIDALDAVSVRRFLRPFLMDSRVVDLPWPLRAALVYGIVLPLRPKKVLPQYQKIWLKEGSPLLVYGQQLEERLQQALGERYRVKIGMRYGQPSMADALDELMSEPLDEVIILPLYPQYASSTTGSTLAECFRLLSKYASLPKVRHIDAFYQNPDYISVLAKAYKPVLEAFKPDHVLFSYHGVPERHIRQDAWHQLPICSDKPCPAISPANQSCYRAQCYDTSRRLARSLWLDEEAYGTVFQSRFGKAKWIEPDFLAALPKLRAQGVKRLAVATPSFVADCLETLEEIGMAGREAWLAEGGEAFCLLPCPNAGDAFVKVLAQWVQAEA